MTLEQLEQKVEALAREVAELRQEIRPLKSKKSFADSFGMFAGDAEFDEIVRLGREYRQSQGIVLA